MEVLRCGWPPALKKEGGAQLGNKGQDIAAWWLRGVRVCKKGVVVIKLCVRAALCAACVSCMRASP